MTIKKRVPMQRIAVRLPREIVEQAKKVASKKGVKDSDVYRTIIVSFFKKTVNKTETVSTMERSIEPA